MIWVIGSNGMLGQDLCLALKNEKLSYTGTDREVDILSPAALAEKADEISPDWIINCSAYTAVDKAEDDVDLAYKLNRDGVGNIADLAGKWDIPVIHISTDYVFDGTSSAPLLEDAITVPMSVYGKSKLAGEKILIEKSRKYFIIRTAWLYGQFGSNFAYTMIKLMNKLSSIKVVDDQIGSPTWTFDLVALILKMIKSDSDSYGVYHFSGEGKCSWFDFAQEIYALGKKEKLIKSNCEILPCNSDQFPTKVKRPPFSLLSKDKVKLEFSVSVSSWQNSIKTFLKGISINGII